MPPPFDDIAVSRRRVLALGTAAAASLLRPAVAGAQGATLPRPPTWPTEFKQLTPNVYAFIRAGGGGENNASLSNAGLIVGERTAMLVDALGPPLHAKELQAAVRGVLGTRPVTRVVNTHYHRDHTNGDYLWEPAEIVMTEPTRAFVLAAGIPAKPYPERPEWQAGMGDLRLARPTTTIAGDVTYWYGDQAVRLIVPGPAHTNGDIMVHLPAERILFSGDIAFFNCMPALHSGVVDNWLRVIDRIMRMDDVATIVPGHGPVGGKRELAEVAEYLRLVTAEIRRGYNAGRTPGQAAAEADIGRFAAWGNPERIPAAAVRLYATWNGTAPADADVPGQAAAVAEYERIKARERR